VPCFAGEKEMNPIKELNINLDDLTYDELKELANNFECSAQTIYRYMVDNVSNISKRGEKK
jgi:hypothetical protein